MSSSAVQVRDIFNTRMFKRKQKEISCVLCKVWAPSRCSKIMKDVSVNPIKVVPPLKNKTYDSARYVKNNADTPW